MATLTGTLNINRAAVSVVGVADLSQPTNYVVGGTSGAVGGGSNRVDNTQQEGSFRVYANGVVRLILGTAVQRTQTLALRALSPTEVAAINDMIGQIVCFRDTYGRKVFGAFLGTAVTEIPLSGSVLDGTLLTDVGLVIQSTTYDESV